MGALDAIYGEDFRRLEDQGRCEIYIPSASASHRLTLEVQMLPTYPMMDPPWISLAASHIPEAVKEWALAELHQQFIPGEVVLYNWVEWLREQSDHWAPCAESNEENCVKTDEAPLKEEPANALETEHRDSHDAVGNDKNPKYEALRASVVHGHPFTEKKSTFQSHLCPVNSRDQVEAFVGILMDDRKVRDATHNILAYRIHDTQRNTFIQDCNDDGEAAAGARLLHMLQIADVQDVAVVVTRWFGGTLLGPLRFKLINNVARDLLVDHGYIAKSEGGKTGKKKKKK
eukprot:evm.model.scf_985EXC.1 EVM.evm.TU.scf_985EXC.1   scf_985EXC:847-5233(+)